MASKQPPQLAVLVDADNASFNVISSVLKELEHHGVLTVKRAYGDWSSPSLAGWKDKLLEHGFQAIQQFAFVKGKNATDSALIIDAMDLLYTAKKLAGFCIVSNDSDFTRLTTRLRESGKTVIGAGTSGAAASFRAACNAFVATDKFHAAAKAAAPQPARATAKKAPSAVPAHPASESPRSQYPTLSQAELETVVLQAVSAATLPDQWAPLSNAGHQLKLLVPDFKSSDYGYSTLSQMFKAQPYLTVRSVDENNHHLLVQQSKKPPRLRLVAAA